MSQKESESLKYVEESSNKEIDPAVNQNGTSTTEVPIEINKDKEIDGSEPKEKEKADLVATDSAKDDEDDVMF